MGGGSNVTPKNVNIKNQHHTALKAGLSSPDNSADLYTQFFSVLDPLEFMGKNFPGYQNANIDYLPKNIFNRPAIPVRTAKMKSRESIYRDLVEVFNTCLEQIDAESSTNPKDYDYFPLRCFKVESETSHEDASPRPNLILTTQYRDSEWKSKTLDGSCLQRTVVTIEVTKNPDHTLGRVSNTKTCQGSQRREEKLIEFHKPVPLRQYPLLPSRFFFSITIAGHLMRLWKWSPYGCQVTTAIDYKSDATVLIQFLCALESSHSKMGFDFGPGMLFERLNIDIPLQLKVEESSPEQEAATADASLQQNEQATMTSSKAERAVEIQNRKSRIRKLYSKASKNVLWGKKAINRSLWSFKHPKELGEMVVFSHPMFTSEGMCAKSTRIYLGLSLSDFTSNEFYKWSDEEILAKLRTVKTSWQDIFQNTEGELFARLEERRKLRSIEQLKPMPLAKMLARGRMGSTQRDGIESSHGVKLKKVDRSPALALHWLVFEQVGYPLNSFTSTTCLLQALLAALNAHEACFDEGILHRDLSSYNILLDIKDSSGFLIDLDGAWDLQGPLQVRSQVGTRMFMASIMGRGRILHRAWHDLESLFWILVFLILRYVDDISFSFFNALSNRRSRKEALDFVFNQRAETGSEMIRGLSYFKKDDLLYAFEHMKDQFYSVYRAFQVIDSMKSYIKRLEMLLDPNFTPETDPEYPEYAGEGDLLALMSSLLQKGNDLMDAAKIKKPLELDEDFDRSDHMIMEELKFTMSRLQFPTYESIRSVLTKAIQKTSPSTLDIPKQSKSNGVIDNNSADATEALAEGHIFVNHRQATKRKVQETRDSSQNGESKEDVAVTKRRKMEASSGSGH